MISNAGVNVNPHPPHPGTRWGLVEKRRGFKKEVTSPRGWGIRKYLYSSSKGRKKEKEALKRSEPTLYSYFEEVWGVRNRHMVKDLPHPYVFMLLSCNAKDRPHPRGEENGNSDDGNTWFPGSPPLRYFPIPIADLKRPWG